MNNSFPITFCIPFFNAQNFIKDFLCGADHCPAKFIFVDDGSTDGGAEQLKHHIQQLSLEAEIISTDSRLGAGHARNKALDRTTTDYVSFFDIDDKPQWDALSSELPALLSKSKDLIYFGYQKFSDDGLAPPDGYDAEILSNHHQNSIKPNLLRTSAYPWNKIYKRSFIQKHELRFSSSATHNDLYFVRAAEMLAEDIQVFPKQLYHYRVASEGSISGISDSRRCDLFGELKKLDMLCESSRPPLTKEQFDSWQLFQAELIRWAEKKIDSKHKLYFHKGKNSYLRGSNNPHIKPTTRLKLLRYMLLT